MSASLRFVSKDGNDNSDGEHPASAKLTVAEAISSLPTVGSGGQQRKSGDLVIGPGVFVEEETLEFSSDIRYHGTAAPVNPTAGTGTIIQLGHNGHLLAPNTTFTDYAHTSIIHDLMLDGGGRTGDYDLLCSNPSGFLASLQNVYFSRAPRFGMNLSGNAVSLHTFNIAGALCAGGLLNIETVPTANLFSVTLRGVQADNCGQFPINIISHGNGNGYFKIDGGEYEASAAGQHDAIINYVPAEGDNGISLYIEPFIAWKSGGGGEALITIRDGDGASPYVEYRVEKPQGYDTVFKDYKRGFETDARKAVDPGNPWASIQLGASRIWRAPVDPNGQVPGSIGDICIGEQYGHQWKCAGGTTWIEY